jgi:hypothetical protein
VRGAMIGVGRLHHLQDFDVAGVDPGIDHVSK